MNARLRALYVVVATVSLVAGLAAPLVLGSTTYAVLSTTSSAAAGFRLDIPTERACAVWAGNDLEIRGSRNRIDQCSHANDDIYLRGGHHVFKGSVRYVDMLDSNGNGHVFERGADKVATTAPPVVLTRADYAPGGRAALAAGSDYHPHNESVTFEAGELKGGLHYVPGDIIVRGSQAAASVTLVATGRITIESDDLSLAPFADGLVLGSWRGSGNAVDIYSDRGVYDGLVYAPSATIQIDQNADGNTFSGKLVAGGNIALNGNDNIIAV